MDRLTHEMTLLRGEFTALRTEVREEIHGLRTEIRREIPGIRQEIGDLRSTMSRGFAWLVGLQAASLIATIGAMAAALYTR
jgi:hypothetical protein